MTKYVDSTSVLDELYLLSHLIYIHNNLSMDDDLEHSYNDVVKQYSRLKKVMNKYIKDLQQEEV